MLNRVILIGNLTQDPELRYTPDGTPVASFTLAVNRPYINQSGERETDFIPVVVWRKQAERCSDYLTKGSQVAVDGRLQIRSYEDRDGVRRKVSEVIAWRVEFLQRLKKPLTQEAPDRVEEEVENDIDSLSIPGEQVNEEKDEGGEHEEGK